MSSEKEKCSSCGKYRMFLNKDGICLICQRANSEEGLTGNWKPVFYPRKGSNAFSEAS